MFFVLQRKRIAIWLPRLTVITSVIFCKLVKDFGRHHCQIRKTRVGAVARFRAGLLSAARYVHRELVAFDAAPTECRHHVSGDGSEASPYQQILKELTLCPRNADFIQLLLFVAFLFQQLVFRLGGTYICYALIAYNNKKLTSM